MNFKICKWLGISVFAATTAGLGEDTPKKMIPPFSLEDTAMEELIHHLRRNFEVNVALENFPVTWKQAISYRDALEDLGERKPESLNERERRWLKKAVEIQEKEPEKLHYKFHYYQKRFDLKIDQPTPLASVLEAAVALDPRYQVRIKGSHVAIVPKENSYRQRNSIRFAGLTVREALDRFEKEVLKQNDLSFMFVVTGPGPFWFQSDRKVSLELENAALYDSLHEFADAAGENLTWEIAGYRSGRHLSLTRYK